VAVYLHTVNNADARFVEASHDTDVVISLTDLSYLREMIEVVSNPRLRKSQVIVEGVEVDVYVERSNRLVVPYDELFAHAVQYGSLRVACPEHLLALKLVATDSRQGSSKGDKDERDLVRLAVLGHHWSKQLIEPYVGPEHLKILKKLARSKIFSILCEGNEHEAKKVKRLYEKFLTKISRVER
jgi:hypothetical protein